MPASTMATTERLFNTLVGVSVLSWAVMGVAFAGWPGMTSTVRVAITGLHLCVGTLLLVRKPLVRDGSFGSVLLALPSLVVCGLAFRLSPRTDLWPVGAEVVFVAGAAVAITAFLFLGRSFAVLPAARDIVAAGPYRVVRHPAYAGELLMVLACFMANQRWLSAWPLVCAVPTMMIRIRAEEAVLGEWPEYGEYSTRVPWHLVPGIW